MATFMSKQSIYNGTGSFPNYLNLATSNEKYSLNTDKTTGTEVVSLLKNNFIVLPQNYSLIPPPDIKNS
jgi:hypothetical protein